MKHTIILLHGWGLSKKKFDSLAAEFTGYGYPVVALDFPGFGEEKSPARAFTLTDYAHHLHQYIQKEHIQYPILVGHSFGGRIGLRYNTLYPKSVRALILTGTPGYTPISRKRLLLFISIAKIGKSVVSLPTLSYFSDFLRKWYYYVVGAKEYYRAEGVMRDTFKNIVSEPLVADMKAVDVPCLLVWGEHDIIVPLKIGIKMRDTISGSVFEMIEGADHGVPFKKPKEFVSVVVPFLNHL